MLIGTQNHQQWSDIVTSLNDLISRHEARIATLRQLANDPAFAAEILSALTSGATPAAPASAQEKPMTQLERVLEVLKDGRWRTVAEIASAVQANKTSIAPLFCRNADRFEKRKHPTLPGRVQRRMKFQPPQDRKDGDT